MTSSRETAKVEPVESFKPTSGMATGYVGLGLSLAALGYVIVSLHTLTGLRIGLGVALLAVVIWVTQLRPRATAYPETLRLRNSLRDVDIPLASVQEVSVRATLNVWVADKRYVCIGIGRSTRHMLKRSKPGGGAMLGMARLREYGEQADRPGLDQSDMRYDTFVVTRIEELVEQAKKDRRGLSAQGSVRRTLAWPEIAALTVLGVCFVVSIFV